MRNRLYRRASRGASLVEFLLGATLVLLPFGFAILELAQLTAARNALSFAAYEAARAGAVTGIDRGAMRLALARGLTPLFARGDEPSATAVLIGSGVLARSIAEVARPDLLRLTIENPTPEAFADFARIEAGVREIPNENLEFRNPFGTRSNQTLRDANVLALRVRYCRELVMPITSWTIPALLRRFRFDAGDQLCFAQGRLPIEVVAVVHMQSPARAPD